MTLIIIWPIRDFLPRPHLYRSHCDIGWRITRPKEPTRARPNILTGLRRLPSRPPESEYFFQVIPWPQIIPGPLLLRPSHIFNRSLGPPPPISLHLRNASSPWPPPSKSLHDRPQHSAEPPTDLLAGIRSCPSRVLRPVRTSQSMWWVVSRECASRR